MDIPSLVWGETLILYAIPSEQGVTRKRYTHTHILIYYISCLPRGKGPPPKRRRRGRRKNIK
jgi:hypothetical protein